MYSGRTTLSKFLIEQLRGADDGSVLAALLVDVAAAVKAISAMTAKGALGADGETPGSAAARGDGRARERRANEAVLRHCEWGGLLGGMASTELELPYSIPADFERGPFLLLFEPLHGAAGSDVNGVLGSVFSVLRHPRAVKPADTADFLQPGRAQVAAGYALYGPSTMLVLSVGLGTHAFTLDRETGNFLLTHPDLRLGDDGDEVAVNAGNERYWEPPVVRYVRECCAGRTGARERDFKIRWVTSTVAQVHRVLIRGGVFLYPRDSKAPGRRGRLPLLFEVNAVAFLTEHAGGKASTGRDPILDLAPESLHQRVPVILGSRAEVERIERYHLEFDQGNDQPYANPLFNERSLFRNAAGL